MLPSSSSGTPSITLTNHDGSPSHWGTIQFVGNISKPKPFLKISDTSDPKEVYHFLNVNWKLPRPRVLISVTGGAQDFKMKPRLESVFSRGLVRAAQNTEAWIVTGGTDSGVMSYVGKAVAAVSAPIPTFGIASYYMVTHHETFEGQGVKVPYKKKEPNSGKGAALDPNHSHFIFVDKGVPAWGAEIAFRTALEDYITEVFNIPVVLVVVQGGPGTLKTVEEGVKRHFPIILVEGSGGAADAVATCLKQEVLDTSVSGYRPEQRQILENIVVLNKQHPTIFPFLLKDNATTEMDSHILRAILRGTQKQINLTTKMTLCVEWNRVDILKEVLRPKSGETASDTAEHQESLNEAFQKALSLGRKEIFSLLLQHGANVSLINLYKLYTYRRSEILLNSLSHDVTKETAINVTENPENQSNRELERQLTELNSRKKIPRRFEGAINKFEELQFYYQKTKMENETSITDLLIWAVFSNKDDLAYEIWKTHDFSLHSALLCSYIYGALSNMLPSQSKIFDNLRERWEKVGYEVLEQMASPEIAHTLLEATWGDVNMDAVKLAVKAEAKSVVSHSYFQKVLDQRLYTSEHGVLAPSTSNLQIISIILLPFLYMTFLRNPFKRVDQEEQEKEDKRVLFEDQSLDESTTSIPIESEDSQSVSESVKDPRESLLSETIQTEQTQESLATTTEGEGDKGQNGVLSDHEEDNPWSWSVYTVPIVKLWTKNLAYVLYLAIVSTVALTEFNYKISIVEYILGFWVLALISDEWYEYHENPEGHFDTITNKLDFSILVTWVIYYGLRILSAILENDDFNEYAVYLISLIIIASCLRSMQIFQLNPVIGPLLIMINHMAMDIIQFFGMFLLLFIGAQVAMISVSRNVGESDEYEDVYPNYWKELYPQGVQLLALWGFVGEFGFDSLREWPIGYIVLAVYILFSAIMMQNLLIAMMADSYQKVNDNAELEWKFERYYLVEEQQSASILPPPFNIFEVIATRFTSGPERTSDEMDTFQGEELVTLKNRLIHFRSLYLEDKAEKENQSIFNRSEGLNNRLDNLHTRRTEDREYMERRCSELKSKLEKLKLQQQQ